MAGYSGTPLQKKLGIKEGQRVAFIGASATFAAALGELPPGVSVHEALRGTFDVIVLFAKSKAELARTFGKGKAALVPDGGYWIAWPKKASGVPTDLTEDVIRSDALAAGLVEDKVCAIDDIWSGLRLVFRVADRPAVIARRTAPATPATKRTVPATPVARSAEPRPSRFAPAPPSAGAVRPPGAAAPASKRGVAPPSTKRSSPATRRKP